MSLLTRNHGLALLAGAVCVSGFAPFGFFPAPVLALAVLFALMQRAALPRAAAWLCWSFGVGLFSAGTGWIYIALHDYGDMPMLLALPGTLLFCAFLGLFPALAGYAQARIPVAGRLRTVLVMPVAWVLAEWVRGTIFTGFPWLTMGYAHSVSPLAGYAPLLGVYGVSLAAAVSAGLLAVLWSERWNKQGRFALAALAVLWISGAALCGIAWTQPSGEPFSVALVQGNIAQELKFNQDALVGTLETYRRLALQSEARLTVLPETALPLLRHEVPPAMLEQLRDHARRNGGDMLTGSFERDQGGYYNSVFSLGSADEQHYRKQHLVVFGEFIPLRPLLGWFINGVLNIPMGDLARGGARQAPLNVAGQRVAVNICYEDAFGEEIIRALPNATLLVNVTNDAWYGNSHAAAQHNQISQMRALETGRMMLRATNTGVTSIIGTDGKVLQQLPQHEEDVLEGQAQGYEGVTPYVRWGNAAVMLLIAAMLGYAWLRRKRIPSPPLSAPSPALPPIQLSPASGRKSKRERQCSIPGRGQG
ncbi:MAG: apolipoprotein N-acyltransferase [Gallionella sp.]|nr:apolipoprotein N-acyltransferase [Gallionella sp.]